MNMSGEIALPGFRFHPTEEELLDFYLKNMVVGKKLGYDVIGYLNIYHHDPWDLPGLARVGEREWYFFVPRDKKHGSGGRPNRTTEKGFWKATGSDRKIVTLSDPKRVIGLRKTLVFYQGRAPRGNKTDWVMNEYRLPDNCKLPKEMVLCKIYRKATSLKVLEERAAEEEEREMKQMVAGSPASPPSSISTDMEDHQKVAQHVLKKESESEEMLVSVLPFVKQETTTTTNETATSIIQLPFGKDKLPDLHLPMLTLTDWTQDTFWAHFNSPWLQNFTPSNLLNFY